MKSRPLYILFVLSTALVSFLESHAAEMRSWTSNNGSQLEAEWIRSTGAMVYLRKPGGKVIAIPLNRFEMADRAYLKSLIPAAPPTPQELKAKEMLTQMLAEHENPEVLSFKSMHYRLLQPPAYDPSRTYPLVVALHGGVPLNPNTEPRPADRLPFYNVNNEAKEPCFYLAPAATKRWQEDGESGSLLKEIQTLLDTVLSKAFRIDKNRIYIIGNSDGGTGILHAMCYMPDYYAAAIPMSGWLGRNESTSKMTRSKTAVWWFATKNDSITTWPKTEALIDAYIKRKGNLKVTVVEENGNHGAPNKAYSSACSGVLMDGTRLISTGPQCDLEATDPVEWMFKQKLP